MGLLVSDEKSWKWQKRVRVVGQFQSISFMISLIVQICLVVPHTMAGVPGYGLANVLCGLPD